MPAEDDVKPPTWLELKLVKPLSPDVEDITSLDVATIKRRYPEYIVRLSDRRLGMKLRNALDITNGK